MCTTAIVLYNVEEASSFDEAKNQMYMYGISISVGVCLCLDTVGCQNI